MKIFKKEILPNGRRHIYFCGIKIASYKKAQKSETIYQTVKVIEMPLKTRFISNECLPVFLRDKFFEYTGKLPTEKLETLSEKLIWASMFDNNPLKTQCADKYTVRDYVKNIIGEKYLPKLYAVYKNGDDFDIDKLPESFVLTFNAGSGTNLIITDKKQCNVSEIKNTIRKWMVYNHADFACEMQYKDIKPLVLARECIDIREDIEYKLWCFHGRVGFIQLISYKYGHNKMGDCNYSRDWKKLDFYRTDGEFYVITDNIERPKRFDDLIEMTEKLAKPFDFVRVDFYETKDGELVFGELTFTPTAGRFEYGPDNNKVQKYLGDKYIIPLRDEQGFAKQE